MIYNFLKFGITSNLNLDASEQGNIFYSQNKEKIEQIYEFLMGSSSCLVLSGFQGTGKSKIIDKSLSYLNSDVLTFRYHMYEATTLDDLLLNLIIDFRNYHKNMNISLPKIDTKDFRERIKVHIKTIERPMLLVLESCENIFRFEETSSSIIDFLLHLSSIDKFKIVFVSRSFDTQVFKDRDIEYDKILVGAFDEDVVASYLDENDIEYSEQSLEKLVQNSHCYIKYLDMTIKLLQTFDIPLDELIKEFELKQVTYSKFLMTKFITLIPEKAKNLVYLLAILRQGVTSAFLSSIDKNNAATISYLKNLFILNEDSQGNLYIKDYFAKELRKELDQFSTLKIHSYFVDYYEKMLPKRPFERELVVSRTTMRREKAYHESFVEDYKLFSSKQGNLSVKTSVEKNNVVGTDTTYEEIIKDIKADISMKNYDEFAIETAKALAQKELIVNSASTTKDYIALAEKYEVDFDYKTAAFYYQKALEKNTDATFEINRPNVLVKVAKCYIKMQEAEKAVKYFDLAYEIYSRLNQTQKASEILYEIALEYKNNYKFYVAKNYVEKILKNSDNLSDLLLAKAYSLLADIEDLSSNVQLAKDLYKKALDSAIKTNDEETLAMAYFKYGLLLDDTNQQTQAMECYEKCIGISLDPQKNIYLSSAYSNLAGILYEREYYQQALDLYNKALDVDKIMQNNEGIYFVYSKLASIYEHTDKQVTYKYLLSALQAARRLNDNIYISSAYLEIGDYYYNQQDNIQAIKAYLSAKHFVANEFAEENKIKIQTRLNDLKIKLGENDFKKIIENFKYKDEYQEF